MIIFPSLSLSSLFLTRLDDFLSRERRRWIFCNLFFDISLSWCLCIPSKMGMLFNYAYVIISVSIYEPLKAAPLVVNNTYNGVSHEFRSPIAASPLSAAPREHGGPHSSYSFS